MPVCGADFALREHGTFRRLRLHHPLKLLKFKRADR